MKGERTLRRRKRRRKKINEDKKKKLYNVEPDIINDIGTRIKLFLFFLEKEIKENSTNKKQQNI